MGQRAVWKNEGAAASYLRQVLSLHLCAPLKLCCPKRQRVLVSTRVCVRVLWRVCPPMSVSVCYGGFQKDKFSRYPITVNVKVSERVVKTVCVF